MDHFDYFMYGERRPSSERRWYLEVLLDGHAAGVEDVEGQEAELAGRRADGLLEVRRHCVDQRVTQGGLSLDPAGGIIWRYRLQKWGTV
jgi:hypothetical protein